MNLTQKITLALNLGATIFNTIAIVFINKTIRLMQGRR